jgi:invasion protein IalB
MSSSLSSSHRRLRGLVLVALALVGAQVGVFAPSAGAADPGPDDHVYVVGDAVFHGSTGDTPLSGNVTGIAGRHSGDGYWLVTATGRVHAFGAAPFIGDFASWPPYRPIVDIAASPGGGYWLVDDGGSIYGYNAPYHGSTGWWGLSSPIVAMEPTATGAGYWLVDKAGGVYAFGDAQYFGSMSGITLNQPIVDIAATPTGHGYRLLAQDAGVFNFGDAEFFGSPASNGFSAAAIEPTPTGLGYWIVGTDGRVSSHGDAPAFPAVTPLRPITAAASTSTGGGLWLASEGNGPPPPPPPGGIDGVVTDDTGAPAPAVCVGAFSGGPAYRSFSASTSVTGYYRMADMPTGDYSVSFHDCDYQDYGWASYPGPVTVSSGTFTTANSTLERVAALSGTVTDAAGGPISGACVNVIDAPHHNGSGTQTSVTGYYQLTGLRASSYSVEFRGCDPAGENWAAEWWDDKPSEATSDRIDLRPGDRQAGIDAVLAPGAAITGSVTDESDNAIASMCVQAYTPDGESRGFAHTSVTGFYRIAGLQPGDYKVNYTSCNSNGSSSPSFAAEWWDDKPTLGTADAVTTAAGTTAEHIDAVLAPAGTISGRITDTAGNPLSGICMAAYDSDNIHVTYNWTNPDGTYELTGMGNASYRVRASDCTMGAYATEWYNDKPTRAQADLVAATAGGTTAGIDFSLARAGSVSGVVTDAGGRELQGVCVQTFDPDGSPGHETSTSITGFYRLSSLHSGDNYVQFRDCGGRGLPSEWFDDKPDRASATPVTAGPDQEVTANASLGVLAPPGAPTNAFAHPADGSATVTWSAPASDGGGPITGYTVTASPGGTSATTNQTSVTLQGLANGTSYTFTVRATNGAGDGPESAPSEPVTPARVPDAPTAVAATGGNASAAVSWTAPASDGGSEVTGYTVTASPGGTTAAATGTSTTVTGLKNGTSYTFTVRAGNRVGSSSESAPSNAVTPATTPGAPTDVAATAGNAEATVTWKAPESDGGSAVTGYTVTASPGGATASTTGTSATFTGLANGTGYTFTVRAANGVGDGPPSAPSNAVTPGTVPDAPTDVVATRGNGSASVTWTAPASDGGRAITGYAVTASPGGATATTAGMSATVTGLANGTSYTFTVRAANITGEGASSAPSNAVTPATTPDAPTNVTAVSGIGSATVSWDAPGDGGAAIIRYTVTAAPGGATATTTGTSTTVTSLANGTAYTFTVHAVNDVGVGSESASSNSVTPGAVPDAPTDVVATRGNGSAQVSWTAPAFDGGSPVSGYTVTASPGGATGSATTTSATVAGLANGTAYTFTVRAGNVIGDSAESAPSAPVTPATTPDAPLDVSAVAGNASATVSWTAPGDGGAPVIRHTVTATPGGATATTTGTSATVAGLANGTAYSFTVHAVNDVGNGPESAASNAVTPSTTPGSPSNVTAEPGNGQATVTWSAPASDGGSPVTGYTVTASPGGATASTAETSAIVAGLANGTSYTFTVVATNANGDSEPSAASNSVTPATTPDAPTAVNATAGPGTATVSWTAPASDGGSPVTQYTVTASPGGATVTGATTSATVTGLTNGTSYTFTVRAGNDVGDSAESTPSKEVIPVDVPGAPTDVTATRGNGEATVSWTAPAANGGRVVTGYTVTASSGATVTTGGATTVVFGGLANGTSYTFTVRATNDVGNGPESAPSNAVTPATTPGAPTDVRGTGINGGATVTWTAPASNGGSAITQYTVTASPGGATATSSTTSATVTGLTNGLPYTFTVRAANEVGTGPQSAPSNITIPLPVPGPPLGVAASAGEGSASVTWLQPSTADAITSYTVTASDGTSTTVPSTQRSTTVTGLASQWYTFTVRATNAVGTGPASEPSNRVKPKATAHRAF